MAANRQISYIKPDEPRFLAKFKKDAGYKEGPTIDTKKEAPSLEDLPDRPDNDDEKPVVVVLKKGDLTEEEAEQALKETNTRTTDDQKAPHEEHEQDGDGRIVFRKPIKRSQADASDLNVSSSKKKKDKEKKQKSSLSKKVQNASLLSFGDEEEEEDT